MDLSSKSKILSYYKGKKVFLTGHTGFKGAWLSYILDKSGCHVFGYSLKQENDQSLFRSLSLSNNFKSFIGDICDYNLLQKCILDFQPEIIINFAAQAIVSEAYSNPYETYKTNLLGTLNVLEIVRKSDLKVTLLFITTDKVYKNKSEVKCFNEIDELGGSEPYSNSKANSESIITDYFNNYLQFKQGVSLRIARGGNVIGGGDWNKNRLFPDIAKNFFKGKKVIIRNPNHSRPWQYILDCLFGYLTIMTSIENHTISELKIYNIGPNVKESIKVSHILEILNIDYIKKDSTLKETKHLVLDVSKAKKELNFTNKYNTKASILRTFNWYKMYFKGEDPNLLIEKELKEYLDED